MNATASRFIFTVLLVGGMTVAANHVTASPPAAGTYNAHTAFAAPAMDNDNNDDQTNDNSEERILRGQVIELYPDMNPPEALVATTRENVWARLYNHQLERSGIQLGDHVRMQGEHGGTVKGVFDAYEVDVQNRCCSRPDNDNND